MNLGEWPLVISVIAAFTAMAALGRAAVRDMGDHLDHRFAEAETRRQEASAAWQERLRVRDDTLAERRAEIVVLQQQMAEIKEHIADHYVSRHTWMEHVGSTNIKLDKLLDELRAPTGGVRNAINILRDDISDLRDDLDELRAPTTEAP